MADLLGLLLPWLTLAALAGVSAGWFLHCLMRGDRAFALEEERTSRREELIRLASGAPVPTVIEGADPARARELETEIMALKLKGDEREAQIIDLERQLADARGRGLEAEALRMRIAELERAPIGAIDTLPFTQRISALEGEIQTLRERAMEADALRIRAGELQTALDAALKPSEADVAAKWRQRYLEARVKYLEGLELEKPALPPAPLADPRVPALEADLAAAQARITALESAPPPVDPEEHRRLGWRARYLDARTQHLEGLMALPRPAPPDPQEAAREGWRKRYLEARVAFLEGQNKAAAEERVSVVAAVGDLDREAREAPALRAALAEAEARGATTTSALEALRAQLAAAEAAAAVAQDQGREVEELRARAIELEDQVLLSLAAQEELEPYRGQAEALAVELAALKAQPPKVVVDDAEVRRLAARVQELEHELAAQRALPPPASVDESELTRLRWKGRYLDSRVQYLEDRLAAATRAAAPVFAAPPEPAAYAPQQLRPQPRERFEWRQVRVVDEAPYVEPPPPPPPPPPRERYEWRQIRVVEDEPAFEADYGPAYEPAPAREPYPRRPAVRPEPAYRPEPAPQRSPRYVWRAEPAVEEEFAPEPPPRGRERMVWRQVLVSVDGDDYAPPGPVEPGLEERPASLKRPRGGAPDDLRMIAGVGPRIEATLNSLGVYHFDQIESWTGANIAWVEKYMRFPGRIRREGWVEQARALARGEMTEGKRRYLAGDHD